MYILMFQRDNMFDILVSLSMDMYYTGPILYGFIHQHQMAPHTPYNSLVTPFH